MLKTFKKNWRPKFRIWPNSKNPGRQGPRALYIDSENNEKCKSLRLFCEVTLAIIANLDMAIWAILFIFWWFFTLELAFQLLLSYRLQGYEY